MLLVNFAYKGHISLVPASPFFKQLTVFKDSVELTLSGFLFTLSVAHVCHRLHFCCFRRKLKILVAQEDSSYMPSRVVVFGGTTSSDVTTQLSCVNVGSTDRDVVILENARRYWPIIRISIRRCQQVRGGDCLVDLLLQISFLYFKL